jgi:hypothetical protein
MAENPFNEVVIYPASETIGQCENCGAELVTAANDSGYLDIFKDFIKTHPEQARICQGFLWRLKAAFDGAHRKGLKRYASLTARNMVDSVPPEKRRIYWPEAHFFKVSNRQGVLILKRHPSFKARYVLNNEIPVPKYRGLYWRKKQAEKKRRGKLRFFEILDDLPF